MFSLDHIYIHRCFSLLSCYWLIRYFCKWAVELVYLIIVAGECNCNTKECNFFFVCCFFVWGIVNIYSEKSSQAEIFSKLRQVSSWQCASPPSRCSQRLRGRHPLHCLLEKKPRTFSKEWFSSTAIIQFNTVLFLCHSNSRLKVLYILRSRPYDNT